MHFGRFWAVCVAMSIVAGCTSTGQIKPHPAFDQSARLMDECDLKVFPTNRAKAECMNAADRHLIPAVGSDADLVRHRMAKRVEIAGRIDRGQISRERGNAELTRVYSKVQSERNRRVAIRAQTVATIMQAQNQNNALNSMANSQARIANTLEDAERRRSSVNGQRDPFSWARDYARGY